LKRRVPRTIRNIVISIVILIILFVGSGIAYVYFTNKSDANNAPVATAGDTTQSYGEIKPSKPNPKAPEQAAVESIITPVSAGSNSSISVKTNAGSKCTITVTYKDVLSKDSGLTPKTADAWGNVTWSWTVDASAPVGTWPVKVTCVYNGRSAVVIGDLKVTK
jgi:hypothetical protein